MDEREFELINIIGGQLGSNQRDLSRQMDLSLGMTNMLIRRLLSKGYIRIRQLNKKKVEYLLTPKGFSEKMRKSVRYTVKTINSISLVRSSLARMLKDLETRGRLKFYVIGGSDLVSLLETVAHEHLKNCQIIRVEAAAESMVDGVLLVCREKYQHAIKNLETINVIEELAKDEALLAGSEELPEGLTHA